MLSTTLKKLACCFAVTCLFVAPVKAAPLAVEVSFDLVLDSGTNASGLSGANILFRADFADGTTFVNGCCNQPQANAASHSFTISGATVASSNGLFSDPTGVALFPNNLTNDGFFSEPGFAISLPGIASSIRFTTLGLIPDVSSGDLITLAHLAVQFGTTPSFWVDELGSSYNLEDIQVSAFELTPVPLPAALPLFAGGLGLLGLIGWRRKRAVV